MDHIGIDVHKKESQICILAEGGEVIERRVRTEPRRFAEVLGERPCARILLESSTESGNGCDDQGDLSKVRWVGDRECRLGCRRRAAA